MYAPNPAAAYLPELISDTSVQDDPSHDSTVVGPGAPPAVIAFELLTPIPALISLTVFKSLPSVQELPSQDSVLPV